MICCYKLKVLYLIFLVPAVQNRNSPRRAENRQIFK